MDSIQVAQDQSFVHKVTKCTGTQVEPAGLKLENALTPETVYFVERGAEGGITNPVPLAPFLLLRSCEDCKTPQAFFFNGVKGKHIEYLSYHCGHFHFPDTLAQDFEELLDVSIRLLDTADQETGSVGGDDEESHISYATQGEQDFTARNFEDALRSYQVALMYKETAAAHHKAALAALCFGNAAAGIMHIRAAMDLGDNAVFTEIRDEILRITGGEDPDKLDSEQEAAVTRIGEQYAKMGDETVPRPITLFDRLAPKRFKNRPFMFFGGIVAMAWLLRIILSLFLSHPVGGMLPFMFIGCFCGILLTFTMCRFFQGAYYPMLNQISEKARGRFPQWYRESVSKSFGLGRQTGEVEIVNTSIIKIRKEFVFLTCLLVFAVFFTVYKSVAGENLIAAFFSFYDVTLFIAFSAYPAAVAVFSFLSIVDYSQLSLKPKFDRVCGMRIARITDDLFAARLVGSVLFTTSVIWSPHYAQNTSREVVLTLATLMIVLASAWTLGIPIALYTALARAKARASSEYSRHLERAFREFLKDPLGGSSKKLDELTKESRRVKSISVNPMSLSGWIQTGFFLILYWMLGILFMILSNDSFAEFFRRFSDDVINGFR